MRKQCKHLPKMDADEVSEGLNWLGWMITSVMEGDMEIEAPRGDEDDYDHPRCAQYAYQAVFTMTDYIRHSHNALHERDDEIEALKEQLATAERTVETLQAIVDLLPTPEGSN